MDRAKMDDETGITGIDTPKRDRRSGQRVAGFVCGILFGGLTMIAYFLKASPAEFYAANKMLLLLALFGCGVFGAFLGPDVMTKVGELLSWLA
jgi:hypothetical protein